MSTVHFFKGGMTRQVKTGFSWTVLFFGPFPFAFRGMWLAFIGVLILNLLTWGLGGIIVAFFANKMTALHYIDTGWTIEDHSLGYAYDAWGVR